MSSIMNTTQLIRSIKRRAMLPSSQETFLDADFLEMATEEVNIGMMSFLMKAHEEHLVYTEDVPIQSGVDSYEIPARAQGNKLRDVSIVDSNGGIYELSRFSLEDISDFKGPYNYNETNGFYIQNNYVKLNNLSLNESYSLRMSFYLRPNSLVVAKRAGTISQITTTKEVDTLSPLSGSITAISVANPTVVTCASHGLTDGDFIRIASSDSTPSIDGDYQISLIDSNSFTIAVNVTVSGSTASWNKLIEVNQLFFTTLPEHFSVDYAYDLVQNISPNKIVAYDLRCNNVDTTLKTISIPTEDFNDFKVKQFITIAEETIVPNIPTELHPILAQRVAVACLEALGDEANKQSAERKLQQMELNANSLVYDRVEGAKLKIRNRHSTLAQARGITSRRRRHW